MPANGKRDLIRRLKVKFTSHNAHIYRVYLKNTKTLDRRRTAPKPNMTAKVRFRRTPRQGERCHLKSGLDLEMDLDPVIRGSIRDRQLYLRAKRTPVLRSVRGWRSQPVKFLMEIWCSKIGALLKSKCTHSYWDRGDTVVKVLCYKSEGRWFDSRWCHWNFSLA